MTQQPGQPPESNDPFAREDDNFAPNGNDQSTVQVVRLLMAQGQEYAQTEMQRQKVRVRIMGLALRDAVIFGLVALFLLMGLLIALLVGGVWVLAPHVGPIWALLIVIGSGFAFIIGIALFIRARVMAAMRKTFSKGGR